MSKAKAVDKDYMDRTAALLMRASDRYPGILELSDRDYLHLVYRFALALQANMDANFRQQLPSSEHQRFDKATAAEDRKAVGKIIAKCIGDEVRRVLPGVIDEHFLSVVVPRDMPEALTAYPRP
jgi:hypothetical protein